MSAAWTWLSLLMSAVSLLLCLPCAVLLLEVWVGRRALARPPAASAVTPLPGDRPPMAVLIPAHNEAQGIEATLHSVRAACLPTDRLLVVADNCSDATAELARRCGAEVIERQDSTRRGKGYALDFGVRHLAQTGAPALVLLVDADCQPEPGALDACARLSWDTGRPVQALYLMHLPAVDGQAQSAHSLRARVGAFAWAVKNRLRPVGARAMGWPCQLMGTGMAFPWPLLRDAQLASSHLVEDMQLGIDLALAGHPPLFCPQAKVHSLFPQQGAGQQTQRTRWEHGHLAVITQQGPGLIWQALRRADWRLLGMAADLCVPPLASLVLAAGGWWLLSLLSALLLGGAAAAWLSLLALAMLVTAIYVAWRVEGRALVQGAEWARLPFYALGKLPLYLGWLRRRQTEWIRTERDAQSASPPPANRSGPQADTKELP